MRFDFRFGIYPLREDHRNRYLMRFDGGTSMLGKESSVQRFYLTIGNSSVFRSGTL